FEPVTAGDAAAVAHLQFDAGRQLPIVFSGTGLLASCALEPGNSLSFGVTPASGGRATVRVINATAREQRADVSTFGPAFRVEGAGRVRVPARGETTLEVAFAPPGPGGFEGWLLVRGEGACGTSILRLEGRSVERHVVAERTQLEFGYVEPGAASRASVRLRNGSRQPVEVRGVSIVGAGADAFALLTGRAPRLLAPGEAWELELAFAPEVLGRTSALLVVDVDEPGAGPLDVVLGGTGGGPRLSPLPRLLSFGQTPLLADKPRTLQVRNDGSDPDATELGNLRLATPAGPRMPELGGEHADEFALRLPLAGYPTQGLRAGAAAEIQVQFRPRSPGRKTARLTVFTNDPQRPVSVVTLEGVALDVPACELEVTPPALDFGLVARGEIAERSLEVRNIGSSGECHVFEAAVVTGQGFSLVQEGPSMLRPGETARVRVRYSPPAPGAQQAALVVQTSSRAAPEWQVALSARSAAE
ncbi:MAG: choice-of-anchor D domain-containing protein, partial [Myxococcales bacterium]